MDFFTLLGLSVALGVDAFAVALAAGAVLDPFVERRWLRLGFHFGLFQAMMPVLGWLAGRGLQQWISAYDHWIAFALLSLVGGKMIFEALQSDAKKTSVRDPSRGWTLVILSVATSIDALAVGFSIALLGETILFPALIIGISAAIMTITGAFLGRRIGALWGHRAEVAGGIVLCAIGIKILLEDLFFQML
ncbi:Putative Mn2+ efflux pump MntP [Desulfuromusa kysingii]|uniref:Putative manganese efflux pump MntP n=1 Tax=Desulfuromusa kysingii TaxID=37625 RepID=A0A1H4AUG0_9BACT|nr:manganese efflux pump MntP family protein [Desulfuromusa kysingii]SEA39272.1 Putative Mn2+ efflux pump MntP [Desulfuromusa kysingii]